jgi:hypothetical protein
MLNFRFIIFLLLIPLVCLTFGKISAWDRPVLKQETYYCWDRTPLLALYYLYSTDSSQCYKLESHYAGGNEEFFPNGYLIRKSDNAIYLKLNKNGISELMTIANFDLNEEVDSLRLYWNGNNGATIELIRQFTSDHERVQEIRFSHPDYGNFIYEFGIRTGFKALAHQRSDDYQNSWYTKLGDSKGLNIWKEYRRYLESN